MKVKLNQFFKQDVNGVDVLLTDSPEVKAQVKKNKKIVKNAIVWSIVSVLLFALILNVVILPLTGGCARVARVTNYAGDNKYIAFHTESGLYLSAHRAGGVLEPEETMAAFKQCMEEAERENYKVDILEFDLHLTKDDELVLMHDHEIEKVARPDKSMKYVIEIKDGGEPGKRAMNKLYRMMDEYDIIDRTVFGTFQGEISKYVDECNANGAFEKEIVRSAGITEVLDFYYAFLYGNTKAKFNFKVLQIPMGFNGFFDLSTKEFIDFAHSLGIAVQYWTINDPEDVAKLQANGADCIMTDNPKMAYEVLHRNDR